MSIFSYYDQFWSLKIGAMMTLWDTGFVLQTPTLYCWPLKQRDDQREWLYPVWEVCTETELGQIDGITSQAALLGWCKSHCCWAIKNVSPWIKDTLAMNFSFLFSSFANMTFTFRKNRTLGAKAAIIFVTYLAIPYTNYCLPAAE